MVTKGSKFSKRINYDAIESLFGSGASNAGGLENGGKLYTFDKERDSSIDADVVVEDDRPGILGRRKEYPYDERHELEDEDEDGEGEIVIEEEEGSGGVGFGIGKGKQRDRSRSRGAVSERTDDVTEYDGEGYETMADDDMASHRGDMSYGDYNYDEAYEQEV